MSIFFWHIFATAQVSFSLLNWLNYTYFSCVFSFLFDWNKSKYTLNRLKFRLYFSIFLLELNRVTCQTSSSSPHIFLFFYLNRRANSTTPHVFLFLCLNQTTCCVFLTLFDWTKQDYIPNRLKFYTYFSLSLLESSLVTRQTSSSPLHVSLFLYLNRIGLRVLYPFFFAWTEPGVGAKMWLAHNRPLLGDPPEGVEMHRVPTIRRSGRWGIRSAGFSSDNSSQPQRPVTADAGSWR